MKCQILSRIFFFRFATRFSSGADLDQRQHGGEHHPWLFPARWPAEAHCQVRGGSHEMKSLFTLPCLLQMAAEWRIPGFVIRQEIPDCW